MSKTELSFTQFDSSYWGFNTDPQMNDQVLTEQMYLQTLTELCVNRFHWEGLPKEIDKRFIELQLHQYGLVLFFHETEKYNRYFALGGTAMGEINMYNNPTQFMAIGNSMIQKELNARECVPIWANSMRIPQWRALQIYARKLAKIDRTIDITVDNLRYTRLVTGNANQRQSLVNIMRQVDEGKPLVYTTPNFDPASIQALDLAVHPDVLPKLMDARNSLWNQAMGFLGINNANQDKRERLVASEVSANDEQVLAVRKSNLNARQYAAEQINDMFGLDISVSFDQTDAMSAVPDGIGQFDGVSDDNLAVAGQIGKQDEK
jgi:hypothetical protein